jgi:NAD(P)-dependent dehydrogenase (short-subunit alcohol dehydrogenase family)
VGKFLSCGVGEYGRYLCRARHNKAPGKWLRIFTLSAHDIYYKNAYMPYHFPNSKIISKMEFFFTSKVYLVTGAASGIGLAITSLLLEYGAYVYAIDLSEKQSPGLAELPQSRLTYLQGDVKDRRRSKEIVTSIVQQHNQLDGLVNCAAVCLEEGELPGDELYDPTFDVNVRGAWNYASEALTQMKIQGRGSVVNIGSLASLAAEARLPIYTATKHALTDFTKTWARDFAKYGVRVNMVAPGM